MGSLSSLPVVNSSTLEANFTLPDVCDFLEAVTFIETQRDGAEILLKQYNEEGRKAGPPPDKRFDNRQGGFRGRGGSGGSFQRYDNRDYSRGSYQSRSGDAGSGYRGGELKSLDIICFNWRYMCAKFWFHMEKKQELLCLKKILYEFGLMPHKLETGKSTLLLCEAKLCSNFHKSLICQATVVAAITRTAGATATAMEALMAAVDTAVASPQEEATIDQRSTAREATTRYITHLYI